MRAPHVGARSTRGQPIRFTFIIHRDMVRTLSNIQARLLMSGAYAQYQIGGPGLMAKAREAGRVRDLPHTARRRQAGSLGLRRRRLRRATTICCRQDIENLLHAIAVQPGRSINSAHDAAAGAAVRCHELLSPASVRATRYSTSISPISDQTARKAGVRGLFHDASHDQGFNDGHRIDILNSAYEEIEANWPLADADARWALTRA